MFAPPNRDQVVALAGLFQSAMLVYQLAKKTSCNEEALRSSTLSVLRVEADSVIEVYGSMDAVSMGYGAVSKALSGKPGQLSRDIFSYTIAMHQLSQKLARSPHISKIIEQRLGELAHDYLGESGEALEDCQEEELYRELAALYASTISTLEPRIMVQGSEGKLSIPGTVNKVRSALFAGVRAAWLWHQLGGRRWHLFLYRKTYQSIVARLTGT